MPSVLAFPRRSLLVFTFGALCSELCAVSSVFVRECIPTRQSRYTKSYFNTLCCLSRPTWVSRLSTWQVKIVDSSQREIVSPTMFERKQWDVLFRVGVEVLSLGVARCPFGQYIYSRRGGTILRLIRSTRILPKHIHSWAEGYTRAQAVHTCAHFQLSKLRISLALSRTKPSNKFDVLEMLWKRR